MSKIMTENRSSTMHIIVNDRNLPIDDQGYLLDPDDWDLEVADKLAEDAGITLGDEHKQILAFIRQYYEEHKVAADARFVIKYIAEDMGYGDEARSHLYQLFPYGYMQQVCKIAGMIRPRAWSTG